jgi:rhamnogalacturonyl hydrolase YesR
MSLYQLLTLACLAIPLAGPLTAQQDWPPPGGDHHALSADAAWCWFADPRGITFGEQHEQRLVGYVTRSGNVEIASYDRASGQVQRQVLRPRFQRDDHVNPALLRLPDGRALALYSKHGGAEMYARSTLRPHDASEWTPERILQLHGEGAEAQARKRKTITYPNPVLLSGEDNRIWLFWRGDDWKPNFSVSDDLGKTWSAARTLISRQGADSGNRPYVKVASNGVDTIHLAFTDGHPRNEPKNSIYYLRYKEGAFYKADGSKIGTFEDLPLRPEQCSVVYDASTEANKERGRAWIHDIAATEQGDPVLTFARMPKETEHYYVYSRWSKDKWLSEELGLAGSWFPETPSGAREREPHYSGGIAIDPSRPDVVAASRQIRGIFEIELWTRAEDGKSWLTQELTRNSTRHNVRPFFVRGPKSEGLVWMQGNYQHYTRFRTTLRHWPAKLPPLRSAQTDARGQLVPERVLATMRDAADWQLAHPSRHAKTDWTQAAFYTGLMALGRLDATYLDAMREIGEATKWQLGRRKYMADDHSVGQSYIELAMLDKKPEYFAATKQRFDEILAAPKKQSLDWGVPAVTDRWSWCDALFMAPPVLVRLYAVTQDARYLEFLDQEFEATTSFLFDKEVGLYYRDSRFFDRRTKRGHKVFWSRGNGWSFAGIARVLQYLPKEHPTRARYVQVFQQMAERLATLQLGSGLWPSSLVDPAEIPGGETSGTGFFCYGMAWGIREGLLPRKRYAPIVFRAWRGLVGSVHADGMLGRVQEVAAAPGAFSVFSTEVYGVGSFLLAGSEVYALLQEAKDR